MVTATETQGQALATRLECSLPYLLYKTQARYEEDLRRIHEMRPIISPVVSSQQQQPQTTTSQDARTVAPAPTLTRRVSHTESISTAQYTRSPRRPDRPLLTSTTANSSSHVSSPRPLPQTLPKRLSDSGGAGGQGDIGDDEATNSEDGSSQSSGTEQDEAERKREEQESLGRKLRELGRMMTSDMLGFARPPTTSRTSPTSTRPSAASGFHRGVPERGLGEGERQPANLVPSRTPIVDRGRVERTIGTAAYPSQQQQQQPPFSRVSRFAREIPSIPSSGSSSPGERNPTTVPRQSAAQGQQATSRHRSVSSQGSQASSFSDISGRC